MAATNTELKNTTYEAFVGMLSVLSIVNVALIYIAASDAVENVVQIIDATLSVIFLADFCYRFFTAVDRRQYFFRQYGWADLLASMPFPEAKILRVFRIARAYRLGREQGIANILRTFWRERAQSALLAVLLFIMLLVEFGSMAMVWAEENAEGANITTGSDAVWWAYVTITTVGYGDQFPVTDTGRVIGVLVLTGGVALFGTLTGYLANLFLSPKKPDEPTTITGPRDARGMLAEARRLLEEQESANARLRARLEDMEHALWPVRSE